MKYLVDLVEGIQAKVDNLSVDDFDALVIESEKLAKIENIRLMSPMTKKLLREKFKESIATGKFRLVD